MSRLKICQSKPFLPNRFCKKLINSALCNVTVKSWSHGVQQSCDNVCIIYKFKDDDIITVSYCTNILLSASSHGGAALYIAVKNEFIVSKMVLQIQNGKPKQWAKVCIIFDELRETVATGADSQMHPLV